MTCSIAGCDRPVHARGACRRHYVPKRPRAKARCSVSRCTTDVYAKGMCEKHYARVRKFGTPFKPKHGWPCKPHGLAKLTAGKVWTIRRLRAEGAKLKELAERYKVSEATICSASLGKTWGAYLANQRAPSQPAPSVVSPSPSSRARSTLQSP